MKCSKCGAELNVGCIYCSVCGQEAQIVSDTNLIEEELLRELLKEEEEYSQKQPAEQKTSKEQKPSKGESKSKEQKTTNGQSKSKVQKISKVQKTTKKKKNYKPLYLTLICLAAAIIIGIVVFVLVSNRNYNSYNYQIQKAEQYVSERNYVKALGYYERALELKENDVNTQFSLVNVYILMEEDRAAIHLLHEIIAQDEMSERAYRTLIELYAKRSEFDSIQQLKNTVTNEDILELFEEYEVAKPKISTVAGTYTEPVTVEITPDKNERIYYTTDGSDPIEKGQLYKKAFRFKEQGDCVVKAVACSEYGVYSDVVEVHLTIEFKKPDLAKAVPDSGTFTEPTTITLIGSEGCKMYYTWDGTEPTEESEEYTEPIEVPVGNHILSVILVDKYGMVSDVLKCNYKYIP